MSLFKKHTTRNTLALVAAVLALIASSIGRAEHILVVAPYMEEPGTRMMVDAFSNIAHERDWEVQLIEDMNELSLIMNSVIGTESQPDAIVINLSPELIQSSLEMAAAASIPVIGMDAAASPLLLSNVTSNAYTMAAETSSFIVDALSEGGGVVMIVYEDYAPVQKRGVVARAIFDNAENVEVIETIVPDVSAGSFDSAREQINTFFDQHSEASNVRAIWSAWDEPALGALAAVETSDLVKADIIITGIDATPEAMGALSNKNGFKATVSQDFVGIASRVAQVIEAAATDGSSIQAVYYVPTALMTDQQV
ncbi:MAG: substrate-binding domain-containing protein [Pseudomonadota bacterium]